MSKYLRIYIQGTAKQGSLIFVGGTLNFIGYGNITIYETQSIKMSIKLVY